MACKLELAFAVFLIVYFEIFESYNSLMIPKICFITVDNAKNYVTSESIQGLWLADYGMLLHNMRNTE